MPNYFSSFPSQKKTKSQRTKKWYKECVDAVNTSGFFADEGVRASYRDKIVNSNLYNGKLDPSDMVRVLNPTNISSRTVEAEIQHYPIVNPRIDVLVGEEFKRRFDYRAVVSNPEAISEKSKELNQMVQARIAKLIEQNYSEAEAKAKMQELQQDVSSYQDKREKAVNQGLKHYWRERQFGHLFNNGMRNVFIQGEEYYEAVINGGKPDLWKINPLKVFWVRSGYSNRIEDADLIIIDDYWAPSKIVDFYHEDLTPKQMTKLDKGYGGSSEDPFVNKRYRDSFNVNVNIVDDESNPDRINELIGLGEAGGFHLNQSYDTAGNIRVLRVYWRGWRKVLRVTYFDEFGNEQQDIFPEDYQVKKDEGEYAETLWINEWYEGTKIGEDIYVRMRPKEIQFRSIENPAYSHPGITGKAYSFDSFKTVSLLGKVKNYMYLYDAIHDRLNKLLAVNNGKILEMDFASIPEGWDVDKWFHYLNKMKVAVKDSFKEGNKGAATGKLSGSMNNASKGYIDMDQGANIQQHIALLEFIKREMTEITGVSEQRMGQISNRETVGGVERSVNQSSHITEWYFAEHEEVKVNALRCFVEVMKMALKGKKHKFQYLMDDESLATLEIDGDLINEADYGILITNSVRSQEAEQNIKRLAETALSAGAAQFDDVLDIYLASSLSEMKNNLKTANRDAQLQQQQNAENDRKVAQQKIEQDAQDKELDRQLEDNMNIRDNQTKLAIASNKDLDGEASKLEDERQKRLESIRQFNEKLAEDKRQHNDKMTLERKKLSQPKTTN